MERLCVPRIEEELKNLSPEQRKVVTHSGGPLLVVAGAGSGKTRALTYRTAYLVEKGVPPESILVSTFTNRATKEFRDRLTILLGDQVGRLNIGTLHSTGAKILRSYGFVANINPKFPIYDNRNSFKLVKQVALELDIDKEVMTARAILDGVSRFKEGLTTTSEAVYRSQSLPDYQQLLAQAYSRYQELLEAEDAMDYGDLIMKCVQLLQQFPKVRDRIGLDHLLVDEFQDTDHSQFTMIKLLMGPGRNLMVVGDVDQAIYSFRGANHRLMCDFPQYFPDAVVQSLGKNYRCSKTIVAAASQVIERNNDRISHELSTDNPWGEKILYLPVRNEREEAAVVAAKIRPTQQLMDIPLTEIAVLYRTNIQSQVMEEELLNNRIPYHVIGNRFFERKEILDVICYLRVLDNPDDSAAWHEILIRPKKKVSDVALKHIATTMTETGLSLSELLQDIESLPVTKRQKLALAAVTNQVALMRSLMGQESLPRLVEKIIKLTGIEEFYIERESEESTTKGTSALDSLKRLVTIIGNGYSGLATESLPVFLDYASLLSDEQDNGEGVQLMTLHAAKGTEYEVVFLLGVEEDSIPHWRAKTSADPAAAIEEERRLFYVGMTRAKKLLYLTTAKTRSTFSQRDVACYPSRFLNDIPHSLVTRLTTNDRTNN